MLRMAIKDEKGVSIVLLALSVIVIFGFGALAIDVGHLYHVKDQLQAAADAAALAGAAEITGPDDATKTTNAKAAAVRIAAKNVADVAYVTTPGATPGQPIPVALHSGDIQVGNWNGTSFTFPIATGMTLNAVRVFVRRTGASGSDQPRVQNWFARIFALLGQGFDFSAVTAAAIAAQGQLPLLPIAVNEYWDESGKGKSTYGQVYPESFMRQTNADGVTPGRAGQIFAVLGTGANSNNASFNLNSFVDILDRNRFHTPVKSQCPNAEDGSTTAWWEVKQDSTTGTCSPTCLNNLNPVNGVSNSGKIKGVTNGDVNSTKFDQSFQFLFDGIPDNIIPPNAVYEVARPTPPYPQNNYNDGGDADIVACYQQNDPGYTAPASNNFNDPSNCPYASIPYYSSSGASPANKKLNLDTDVSNGQRFWQKYPRGSRFMVMVYDGTIQANPDSSQANVVTVIGYGIIEIDGYKNGQFNGTQGDLKAGGSDGGAGTAYGHALKHGVAGQADPYLIQPPSSPVSKTASSARKGTCDFTTIIRNARNSFGVVRLVGVNPDVCYGVNEGPNCPK